MRSLKATLGLSLTFSLIAIVALQWWLVSVNFRSVTENYVVSRLQEDVDRLLGAITFNSNETLEIDLDQQTYFDDQPFSGHYYLIQSGEQVLRSPTLWDQDLEVSAIASGKRRQLRLPGPLDQQLLVLSQGFRKQGHNLTVSVAEDISEIKQDIAAFQRNYLLLSAGLLALLLLLQHMLVRRTLHPLQGVQQDLQRLADGEINSVREDVPREIQPLVRELNRLLTLLNQRVERSRRMVGDLAHALKTPLSVLIQTGHSTALENQPDTREQIITQTRTIRQRLERELNRARLGGDSNTGARFNPAKDLTSLIAMLEQAYSDRGIQLQVDNRYEGVWPAEREDILELVGNLIDNACKWAQTRVRISVGEAPAVTLCVEDDGPGCPPELRNTLERRGERLDEQTSGHGLGLAIARDIVEHYAGTLDFAESPLGGLQVTVTLPAGRTAASGGPVQNSR